MRDVTFILTVVAFFAMAAAYVRACASVVGPEPSTELDEHRAEELAA
jgi:hypothetical protein